MSDIFGKEEIIRLIEEKVGVKNGEEYKPCHPSNEEEYYSQQDEAKKFEFLNFYHRNPNPIFIKMGLCDLLNSDLSQEDVNRLTEFSKGKMNNKDYKKLLKIKKVFDTPDEVFREVLKSSETFREIGMLAPEREDGMYVENSFMGIHISTFQAVNGDKDKLKLKTREDYILPYAEEFVKADGGDIRNLGLLLFPSSRPTCVAHCLRSLDYIDKKGIDGLVIDVEYPHIIRLDVYNNNIEMRNFICNSNREKLSEQKTHANETINHYINNLFMDSGFSVSKKEEFIKPVGKINNQFDVINRIKKKEFRFSKKPVKIPD